MEPKVTNRDKKVQLSYTFPNRILRSYVHPQQATNESTVILLAHDKGLRILWRGATQRQYNDTNSRAANGDGRVEELDPDCPYPDVIEAVDIDLQCAILELSVPTPESSGNIPPILEDCIIVTVACADRSLRVLSVPLKLPGRTDKSDYIRIISERIVVLPSTGGQCRALATKFYSENFNTSRSEVDQEPLLTLAVASASDTLAFHWVSVFTDHIGFSNGKPTTNVPLSSVATSLAWHPSSRRSEILLGDVSGAVRIYDPWASTTRSRPSSRDTTLDAAPDGRARGRWLLALFTPSSGANGPMSLLRRKSVISTQWILAGSAILVLLEDGEWGVWDIAGSSQQTSKSVSTFAIHGYLGSVTGSETNESRQRKGGSKLAPMTPNTRKTKAENLFTGPTRVPGVAASGGISTSTLPNNKSVQADESVIMWYNAEIYSIPSITTFWQRSTSKGSGASLHVPNITHISDINLMNEDISSICQIGSRITGANFGVVNTTRDLLVSTDRRMIILQTIRLPTPAKALFQQAIERPGSRDQRMLDVGELDLGGMDRVLDTLANADPKAVRKVGFAH